MEKPQRWGVSIALSDWLEFSCDERMSQPDNHPRILRCLFHTPRSTV